MPVQVGSCFLYTLWHLESVGNHSTHNPPSRLWDSASFHMTSLASHTDTRGTMLFCFKTSVVLCSESFGGLLHLNPRVAFGLYAQVFSSHSALARYFQYSRVWSEKYTKHFSAGREERKQSGAEAAMAKRLWCTQREQIPGIQSVFVTSGGWRRSKW